MHMKSFRSLRNPHEQIFFPMIEVRLQLIDLKGLIF